MRLHTILLTLTCTILLPASARTESQENIEQLTTQFQKSSGKHRIVLANEVMNLLLSKGYGDNLQFDDNTHPDTLMMTVSYYLAEYFLNTRQYDLCISHAQQALPLSKGNADFTWESESLNLMAQAYFYRSDYIDALQYAEQMYALDERHKDYSRMCSTLNTIASIYLAANQAAQARDYILNAIDTELKAEDHSHRSAILGVASDIHQRLGQHQQALDYAQQAYETDQQAGSPKAAIRLVQMATANLSLGNIEQSRQQLDEALPILTKYNITPTLGICYISYGNLLSRLGGGSIAKARQYYQMADQLFIQQGDQYNHLHAIYGLYQSYRSNSPQQALAYIDHYVQLRDSIYNNEVQRMLCYYNTRFHQSELEAQVEEVGESKRNANIGFTTAIVVLLLIIIALSHRIIRLRKKPTETAIAECAHLQENYTESTNDDDLEIEREEDRKFIGKLTDAVYSLLTSGTPSIDQVAEKMNLSPAQLRRKVNFVTGKPASTYIMQIRLTYARRLLDTEPNLSMGEIAFKCGFADNSHFSHAFQKVYGISPRQYLRRAK